jgi:hypothetical protein
MTILNTLLDSVPVPRMVRVKQNYERPRLADPVGKFCACIQAGSVLNKIRKGMSIAVAVGSRGISNQPAIVKALVSELKSAGAEPFIVPAMGSHGGAVAEGQKSILEGIGFTEEYLGIPIRASMETVNLGEAEPDLPVYIDKYAWEADGIVIINRIKPHVAFRGPCESGLAKMITIGLGKQRGAETCHNLGFGRMAEHIPAIASAILAKKQNTLRCCTAGERLSRNLQGRRPLPHPLCYRRPQHYPDRGAGYYRGQPREQPSTKKEISFKREGKQNTLVGAHAFR